MSREAKILIGILVVVVGGMIALFALGGGGSSTNSTGPKADTAKLVKADSHKTGSGKVTVVEFGDYQCPACGQAYPITKQLLKEYDGKINLVFRNFPLPMHPNAPAAAAAAEAAAKQDKFWEMHDKLYETQNAWAESNDAATIFTGYAKDLGLDLDTYQKDVASNTIKNLIEADKSDGNSLGITGTPTFYVDGNQSTSYSHDALKGLIDDALGSS